MLLTNKIYEGNLFMRYSKHLTYAERMFLRARLNRVRHITLDPDGPGVVRIHLVPCYKPDRETPFTAILNGQDILPLNVSWAILLTKLHRALKPLHRQGDTPGGVERHQRAGRGCDPQNLSQDRVRADRERPENACGLPVHDCPRRGAGRSRLNRSVWPIMHRGWPRPTAWT